MNANNARRRNSRARNTQGDIQDPYISSTVRIPHQTITKPRIRNIRTDCIGLFHPLTSTYPSRSLFPLLLNA